MPKNHAHRSNGSNRSAHRQTDGHTGATKRISTPATRSIITTVLTAYHNTIYDAHFVMGYNNGCQLVIVSDHDMLIVI